MCVCVCVCVGRGGGGEVRYCWAVSGRSVVALACGRVGVDGVGWVSHVHKSDSLPPSALMST